MTLDHLLVVIVDIIVGILGGLIGFLLIGDWLAVQFDIALPSDPDNANPHPSNPHVDC